MKLLSVDQWRVRVDGADLHLSAWGNGPNDGTRYWVRFEKLDSTNYLACADDLEGIIVDEIDAAALT